ncbi:hypothetical protein Q8A73_016683 [Channa argus]|nr:hypothetical protein Q8A73_016678 [Channa argus]KAK2894199.1 hypothetical protein Q8A73_016683 [Channa argus]
METLRRSLEWARGRILDDAALEDIIQNVDEYIQEIRTTRCRIVIRGSIDRYSWLVVFLSASNNRSAMVLEGFLTAATRDLKKFAEQWNHHGLRTVRHQSPLQQPSTAVQELISSRQSVVDRQMASTQDMGTDRNTAADARDGGFSETDQSDAAAVVPDVDWHEEVEVPQTHFNISQFTLAFVDAPEDI